jgi:hypothetical protein
MAKTEATEVEWVGGVTSMPACVTGEGAPYRPEALFWLDHDGAVLGSTVARAGELVAAASESLKSTIRAPRVGRARAPTRVRVASEQLAAAIRSGHPGLDVVCAPTPEVAEIVEALRDSKGPFAELERSYLSAETDAEAVASFFRAAAGLFRARPWEWVPDDECVFSVTIERLRLRDAALSIVGQLGESLGFILFSGRDDFEAYLDAAAAIELGEKPDMPPHLVLTFDRGAELGDTLCKEVDQHCWEVASADAYPWLLAVDEDLLGRAPTGRELAIAEAISFALPGVLAEQGALHAAWTEGAPVSRTVTVRSHAGELEVTLRAPYSQAPRLSPSEILARLRELGRGGEPPDPTKRAPLEGELLRRFEASPEAKALSELGVCALVLDYAADHFGATIATLQEAELRRVVFEIIPRKVSVEATAAKGIIEELRAFYAFLEREFGLAQAGACLRVLAGDAVTNLEAKLADTASFGMAKSLFMAGRQAGYDMTSQQGIDAWMRESSSKPLPASVQAQGLGARSRPAAEAARAKKKQRKAARKARQRNR